MTDNHIDVAECDGYAVVTLDRPEKKNALNRAMRGQLLEALGRLDGRVNAVILTGVADSFCSGMDLSEKPGLDESDEVWAIAHQIYDGASVYIAAVNGFARGGGTTLTNACDIAIASREATFGIPEIRFGVYATVAGPTTQLAVPRKIASRMVLTGEAISAELAERAFMINEVCEADALLDKARGLARDLAELKPAILAAAKRGLNSLPFDEAMRREGQALTRRLNTEAGGSMR